MNYKIGDKVTLTNGNTMTIDQIDDISKWYRMREDPWNYYTDEMIEGLVEEETVLNKWNGLKVELELSKSVIGVSNIESLHGERFMSGFVKAIIPPDDYIFKDENGNVINAKKIVLEKKKEYPKTYEECCRIVNANPYVRLVYNLSDGQKYSYDEDNLRLYESIRKLLICRDAYWKLYGEEMGLGKPWEPDWSDCENIKYIIGGYGGEIDKGQNLNIHITFAFPTEEMRDEFYENFKELIERCKELL